MILEKQTESNILQEGESQGSIGMSLDLDSAQVLMQMLSKNLYSDAIGSTIRECASNALDSHRRAGVTDPIIVSLVSNTDNNYEFSVEDFGTGLDADDVKNIISKYGKSTKRNSNTELGMMGLGFKAPLAYSSSFYFVCRKNGVERKYMMYEGEETNAIDLLYEALTEERNGVKIIIPVRYYDRSSFSEKIKEQLAYFESVYFNTPLSDIDNSFSIVRHDDFQWSPLATDQYLHICLDNVYYPIDFKKLDIPNISFPVGLRFSLSDGLFPTPNRESIRYTKEAKDLILAKIKDVADFFVHKYNKQVQESDDVMSIISYYRDSTHYVNSFTGDGQWCVDNFVKHASIPFVKPTLKGVSVLDLNRVAYMRDHIMGEYNKKFCLDNGRFKTVTANRYNTIGFHVLTADKPIYIYSERISVMMKDYLRSKHPNDWNVYVIKKENKISLGNSKTSGKSNYTTYMDFLSLHKYPRSEWRTIIKEYQHVVSLLTKRFVNLDELVIPQAFIDSKQKLKPGGGSSTGVRRKKLEGEITGKVAEGLQKYTGRNCKMTPITVPMENAHRKPMLTIYGGFEHTDKINELFPMFDIRKVRMITFSERELKILANIDLHNWISMEEFMKGEHRVFRRAVTAYLIDKLVNKNTSAFRKRSNMATISSDLYCKMDELEAYRRKNHFGGSDTLYESMLAVAQEKNLFDVEMYTIYKQVNSVFEKLPFIDVMFEAMGGYGDNNKFKNITIDLFKYYKQRVNLENYKIVLNEEVMTPVEENTVEDLA